MEIIFITTLCFCFLYSYVIYPVILCAISILRRPKYTKLAGSKVSTVSIVVAAYNEKESIENKIENLISLRQEGVHIDIVVSSDSSTDGTDDICKKYADRELIKYCRSPTREGKEFAQKNALALVQSDIIIFSDVSTFIDRKSFLNILKYFSDSKIGAVSSQDALLNQHGNKDSESLYLKYEMWIRQMESGLAGTVGMSGSFFATRKEFCFPWNPQACSDFNIAINTARAGSLSISAKDVFGYYPNLTNINDETERRVRTILRGMVGLCSNKDILNPFNHPMFTFQIISHKLMRWLSPWFFLMLMIYLIFIWSSNIVYTIIFFMQITLLFVFALGFFFPVLKSVFLLKVPIFFVASNIAILRAGLKFVCGEKMKTWAPSRRQAPL